MSQPLDNTRFSPNGDVSENELIYMADFYGVSVEDLTDNMIFRFADELAMADAER